MAHPLLSSLRAGLSAARQRPGLALLVYLVNLAGALALSVPVYIMLVDSIGTTGFGDQKLRDFDLLLWQETMAEMGDGVGIFLLLVASILPIYMLWRAVAGAGLAYALHQGGTWPFWRGVRRYGLSAVGLAAMWLVVRGVVAALVFIVAGGLAAAWGGEVGTFWSLFVLMPGLLITGFAVVDLFERYGRLALIVRHESVVSAFATGAAWPFRHGTASHLYVVWFIVAAVVLAVPTLIGAQGAAGAAGVWLAFVAQQLALLVRAAIAVAWTGSEVALFERIWMAPAAPAAATSATLRPAAT